MGSLFIVHEVCLETNVDLDQVLYCLQMPLFVFKECRHTQRAQRDWGDHIFVLVYVQKTDFGEMQRVQNLVRCQFKTSDLLLCSYVIKYADGDVATTALELNCIHSPPRMYWHRSTVEYG